MPPLGMRTLVQRLLVATVVSVVAVGLTACRGQSDIEEPNDIGQRKANIEELKKRAEQGDADAQATLGVLYNFGKGVVQDDAEAVKWFRLAAEQGEASAQFNLGVVYAKGEGVPQDYVEAHKWVNLAAAQSQGEKQKKYSEIRDLISEQMTPEQIAEAQRLARDWKPKTWDELKKGLD